MTDKENRDATGCGADNGCQDIVCKPRLTAGFFYVGKLPDDAARVSLLLQKLWRMSSVADAAANLIYTHLMRCRMHEAEQDDRDATGCGHDIGCQEH